MMVVHSKSIFNNMVEVSVYLAMYQVQYTTVHDIIIIRVGKNLFKFSLTFTYAHALFVYRYKVLKIKI